jgi:hypothetical protein
MGGNRGAGTGNRVAVTGIRVAVAGRRIAMVGNRVAMAGQLGRDAGNRLATGRFIIVNQFLTAGALEGAVNEGLSPTAPRSKRPEVFDATP